MASRLDSALSFAFLGAALGLLAGCGSKIGSSCQLSTDCSVQGNRLCDTSLPSGYCTQLGCVANGCPDSAACVLFGASVPGCPYDDYQSPSRTGQVLCMATCNSDSDCRQSDGYVCRDPRSAPWQAVIIDDNQVQRVCIPAPDYSFAPAPDAAPVCMPPIDGQAPAIDAPIRVASTEAGPAADASDASEDVLPESGAEVGVEAAADAGIDAGIEGGAEPVEGGGDGGPDGGAPADAEGGSLPDAVAGADGQADAAPGSRDAGATDATLDR
ncbi:MAG TPA: hypothetical protein VKU41_01510 [Polyangiaceae bacterium]|nr:hypothetical protein [Polyangiaceae bacterium]